MLVKHAAECALITPNDGCRLRELLHPRNDPVDLPLSLALAELAAGERTHPHRRGSSETYLILAGRARVHVDDQQEVMEVVVAVLVPAHAVQWVEALDDVGVHFAVIVAPPWQAADDERVTLD